MDTKEKILNSAQAFIQQRGVNGFSYADIASEIGIRKASLHHHFATKMDLVAALVERYSDQTAKYLAQIASSLQPADQKLAAYFELYRGTLDANRACVGGMLAAEILTLDKPLNGLLEQFFQQQTTWLIKVLQQGIDEGTFALTATPEVYAHMMLSSLQGALIVARATQQVDFFEQTANGLLAAISKKE